MENLTATDFDTIPRFSYREEPIGAVVSRVGSGVLFVLIMTTALLFLTFARLKNYQMER